MEARNEGILSEMDGKTPQICGVPTANQLCHAMLSGGKFGRSALSSARWRLKTLQEDVELMAPEHCVSALGQVRQQGMRRGTRCGKITQGEVGRLEDSSCFFFS